MSNDYNEWFGIFKNCSFVNLKLIKNSKLKIKNYSR